MKAIQIAEYIIHKYQKEKNSDEKLELTHLKLQKILYYAQGWYLANNNKPLFNERVEAWPYGPVIPKVYDELKIFEAEDLKSYKIDNDEIGDMPKDIKLFLDKIWVSYKGYSAKQLVAQTHTHKPWLEKYNSTNNEITKEDIRKFFRKFLNKHGS
ncbi:Panacea domain-containing protein [Candidatus Margulisiibacteriota bacterium]